MGGGNWDGVCVVEAGGVEVSLGVNKLMDGDGDGIKIANVKLNSENPKAKKNMAIETRQLAVQESLVLLRFREGHFGDAKAIDVKPAKLTKTIAAFANADGGELYIGFDENKGIFSWRGFNDYEDANGHIQAFESLFPLGTGFEYEFLNVIGNKGYVLKIQIAKSLKIHRASDGVVYLRRGAQNLPVTTPEAMKNLERDKGIHSYESETVATRLSIVTESEISKKFIKEVVPLTDAQKWLTKQQLIVSGIPTVAAVVLFADLPQAVLPKRCGIKLYRYKSSLTEGSRETLDGTPLTIEGAAYDLIYEAVEKTKEIISQLPILDLQGLTSVQYPSETLHEVITNAVIHREYALADDVHIRIFDNRVEVESPGRLPGHVTIVNILDESFARNGNIVRVINKFPNPPNKNVGEGLNTAFDAMRKLKLKDPVIREKANSVVVEIRHEKLASAEETVLDYLKSNDTINNTIARSLSGIRSENAMKNVFYRLKERGILEQVPGLKGNKSAWRLSQNSDSLSD